LSGFAILNAIDSQLCILSFVLGSNNLSGELPSEFGNLIKLVTLDLGKCLEFVFHQSFLEFVWVFVVLLKEGLNLNCKNENRTCEV